MDEAPSISKVLTDANTNENGEAKFTLREIEKATGISYQYLGEIFRGRIPTDDKILKLCDFFSLDRTEMALIAEIERMSQKERPLIHSVLIQLLKTYKESDKLDIDSIIDLISDDRVTEALRRLKSLHKDIGKNKGGGMFDHWAALLSETRIQPPLLHDLTQVPCFNGGAGQPSHFSDGGFPVGEADSYEMLPVKDVDENSFCVTVHGDSMETTIFEGDTVLVVPSRPLSSGDICFATWPDEFGRRLVKRFRRYGETIVLESDNKAHEPIVIDPEKDKDVRMYKVTRLIRRF